jgi:hypothetical protein
MILRIKALRSILGPAALAGPDDVLVSATTRDFLDGSGLVLESRGNHELKGLGRAPRGPPGLH